MKRVLLASSALTLLAAMGEAQARDLYVSVLGGANWFDGSSDVTGNGQTGHSIDGDTGFMLGAAIGTSLDRWQRGLRTELEVSYRRNDLSGNWFSDLNPAGPDFDTDGGPVFGNHSTFAIMANLWYDIDIGHKVRPYVGLGAGWARNHFEGAFFETFFNLTQPDSDLNETRENDNTGFAWQLGIGLNYEVMAGVDAGLGYRYFEGPRTTTFFEGKRLRLDNDNHTVFVNVSVNID